MKIWIKNGNGDVVDMIDTKETPFITAINFLREWTLFDDFKKIMDYVDKGEDLIIKAKFKVEWP